MALLRAGPGGDDVATGPLVHLAFERRERREFEHERIGLEPGAAALRLRHQARLLASGHGLSTLHPRDNLLCLFESLGLFRLVLGH